MSIFYCLYFWNSPQPVFISPRVRVAQLNPRALGLNPYRCAIRPFKVTEAYHLIKRLLDKLNLWPNSVLGSSLVLYRVTFTDALLHAWVVSKPDLCFNDYCLMTGSVNGDCRYKKRASYQGQHIPGNTAIILYGLMISLYSLWQNYSPDTWKVLKPPSKGTAELFCTH
jgi:hypothetical protein